MDDLDTYWPLARKSILDMETLTQGSLPLVPRALVNLTKNIALQQ